MKPRGQLKILEGWRVGGVFFPETSSTRDCSIMHRHHEAVVSASVSIWHPGLHADGIAGTSLGEECEDVPSAEFMVRFNVTSSDYPEALLWIGLLRGATLTSYLRDLLIYSTIGEKKGRSHCNVMHFLKFIYTKPWQLDAFPVRPELSAIVGSLLDTSRKVLFENTPEDLEGQDSGDDWGEAEVGRVRVRPPGPGWLPILVLFNKLKLF